MKARPPISRGKAIAAAAIGVLALVMVACSGSRATTTTADDVVSASTGTAPVTLQVWTFQYQTGTPSKVAFDALAADFHKHHPNVTIKWVPVPDPQISAKLLAAAGSKTGPDIAMSDRQETINNVLNVAYANMSPYWNKFAAKGEFYNGAVFSQGGKVLAVQSTPGMVGLYYNKTILNALKIKPPTTMAQLESDFAKIKASGKYQTITTAFVTGAAGDYQLQPWLQSNGVDWCTIGSPKAKQVFDQLGTWFDKGYMTRQSATWAQGVSLQQWLGGNWAFAVNTAGSLPTVEQDAKFPFGVVPFPSGSAGSRVLIGGGVEGIGKYSTHKKLAWQFLQEEFYSKTGQKALVKGGFVPSRTDVAKEVTHSDPITATFAAALKSPAVLPNNSHSLDAQTALGTVFSSMAAGSISPSQAATQAASQVKAALAQGGGTCAGSF